MACDKQRKPRGIVYDSETPLPVWLESNPPSQMFSSDVGSIKVSAPDYDDNEEAEHQRALQLQQPWEDLNSSGRPVCLETITQLAKKNGFTSGKWLFHTDTDTDTGLKVNHLWSIIAKGIIDGHIPGTFAKVTPHDIGRHHVVRVYNRDFTDKEQVQNLEDGLRKAGIKCELKYKPQVYTYLGIDPKNKWRLKPTIYSSVYFVRTGESHIKWE